VKLSAPIFLACALLLPLAGGCTGDKAGIDSGAGPGDSGSVGTGDLTDLTATFNENVGSVLAVRWTAPADGSSWVEYGLDDSLGLSTPAQATDGGASDVTVLGLKASHSYTVQAFTETSDGTVYSSDPFTVDVPARPEGLPTMNLLAQADSYADSGGFILFTVMQSERSWVGIIDRDGDYVWWYDAGEGVLAPTVELARNGDVLVSTYDNAQKTDIGMLERIAVATGEVTGTRTVLGHHDFAELPDGSFAWIAFDTRTAPINRVDTLVTGDAIVIGPEGATDGTALETVFSTFDFFPPAIVCSHAEEVLAGTEGLDWTHANSLAYDDADDAFFMEMRHLDTLAKIDRQTGEVLWTLGDGGRSAMTGSEERPMAHPHWSHIWDDGMMYFDNGDHRTPQESRVVELAFDQDARTYEEVWSWSPGDGTFSGVMGDARKLPGGDVLTAWAVQGSLRQLEGDEIVWQVDADIGSAVSRVRWIEDIYDTAASLR